MLAEEIYQSTPIDATGTMTYGGLVAVGGPSDPIAGYEAFAAEVEEIEDMENRGLVTITVRHRETQTGKNYVDLLIFKRLN